MSFCYRSFLSNSFGKLIAKVTLPMKKQEMNEREIQFFDSNEDLILLTRRNWNFANLFIKGYWKHAARITSSNTIIEAVGKGVVCRPLKERLEKSHDYIVVRPYYTTGLEEKGVSQEITKYVGYEYDWEYDGDNDAFYCSELIYLAYMYHLGSFPVYPKPEGCQEILNPDELSNDKFFTSFGDKKTIRGE